MRFKLTIFLIFLTLVVKAQDNKSKSSIYIEPRLKYMFAAGQVNVQGTGQAFMNTIYTGSNNGQSGPTDHSGNYLGIGAVIGKNLSENVQLGLGLDLDFYFNIGQSTRNTLPLYVDLKYKLHDPKDKNSVFFFADGGYAPKLGDEFYAGFKGAAGIGYAIRSNKTGNSYNISLGYSYQVLRNLQQNVFTTTSTGNSLTAINLQNVVINSIPLQFSITF